MTTLEAALDLASKGFHIFPLAVNAKVPPKGFEDYTGQATKDPEQIKKWWANTPYNIGICTSSYNCNQALVVVDVDNKKDKKGSDELFKLEMEGHMFGRTLSQATPTGGEHLIFKASKPVKQGTNVLGNGLDIRSKGGYIVGPGSIIDGIEYKIKDDIEILDCPEWIVTKCAVRAPEVIEVDTENIDNNRANGRAIHYLKHEAPTAVEGSAGDSTTYVVACKLKDLGVSMEDAAPLMLEHYNDRCSPPWSADEIAIKVYNAYKYGTDTPGKDAPEASFDPVENKGDSYLDKMNEEFALIYSSSTHQVLWENIDHEGQPSVQYLSEPAFKRMFAGDMVQIEDKLKSKADIWLNWPERRQYNRALFYPGKLKDKRFYNYWTGFSVKPVAYGMASEKARKGFDDYIHHIKTNVCGGNEEYFNWIITYFAHLIQKPYEKPRTAMVFRGRKGVGKNVVVERIGKLIKHNHAVAHDSRYLTSNFNDHLERNLMLVLDEAFWSGDKSAEGKLKGLITAPELMIEKKGKDAYMAKNYIRLIIIGNEKWLVPATQDERRYTVFDVASNNRNDIPFFTTMIDNMDNHGGNEVLMDYLLNWDLTKIDHNVALETEALKDQKKISLAVDKEYLYEKLEDGMLLGQPWPDRIAKPALYSDYLAYCKRKNVRGRAMSKNGFGRAMKEVLGYLRDGKIKDGEDWINCFHLPPLTEARQAFDNWIGFENEWD